MKRHIHFIWTVMALTLALMPWHSVTVNANGQTRLISDIREDFNGLLLQLRVFDNSCVIITGGLLDELRTLILDGRKLVTTNKGNLGSALPALVIRAQFHLQSIALQLIIYCGFLFEITGPFSESATPQAMGFTPLAPIGFGIILFIGNQIVQLRSEIAAIETLDERKRNKIVGLLTDALARVSAILNLFSEFFNPSNESGCFFDIGRALSQVSGLVGGHSNESLRVSPQLTEAGPISFENLREVKIQLGLAANGIKDCLHTLREITKEKKWLFKDIREVKELLRASNFGGRAASDLLNLTEDVTKVYTLNGVLVATHSSGLDVSRLANGVYLVMAGNKVRKVAVNR